MPQLSREFISISVSTSSSCNVNLSCREKLSQGLDISFRSPLAAIHVPITLHAHEKLHLFTVRPSLALTSFPDGLAVDVDSFLH